MGMAICWLILQLRTVKTFINAVGLKCTVTGTGDHAVYYIYVDGVAYLGGNLGMNLDTPAQEDYRWNGAQ